MADFNYKQTIYAGMLAMASANGGAGKLERKLVNKAFDHHFNLSVKERKEVLIHWESDSIKLNEIIIADLSLFSLVDQKEAYDSICEFILFRIETYNKSAKPQAKGLDEERILINQYREYADELRKKLKL